MHRISSLLVLSLGATALGACGKTEPPLPSRPVPLAHTSQTDLAGEISDADRLGTWGGLASRWQGQRVRWAVTRHGALCASVDDCHVSAFPIQRPAQHGWMPELSFAPGQYDAMLRQCAGQDPCELTIEATLSQLVVSPELATRVRLANVSVVSARRT